jgi:hypothetical protein
VPLRGGIWAEVKTVVIGEVLAPTSEETTARTTAHSSFSRLTDAAIWPLWRLSGEGWSGQGRSVQGLDGADWLRTFVDSHRHDVVRILDFAHAASYLGKVAEQAQQTGHPFPKC